MRLFLAVLLSVFAWPGHAGDLQLPVSETFDLANGAHVILTPKTAVPMIAAAVVIRGGALADAPGKEGTARILAQLLGKGAGSRDAVAFVDAVADAGGELDFDASREALRAYANFLADDAELMLALLADALQRPTLSQAEFDKLRTRSIQSLAAMKDGDPRGLLDVYGDAWLFRDHPYGRPTMGDETSLAALTLDDVQAFQRDQVGADRAIISIVGDFEPKSMRRRVEKAFGGWHKAAGHLPEVPQPVRQLGPRVLLVDKPGATQTYFWIGQVGAAANDPASDAQDLVETLFGGRFTSMLNTELRVKSGLTYGARASIDRLNLSGAAAYSSYTRTQATTQAIDLALAVQARLHDAAIPADQLDSARRYMQGQYAPRYQTNLQISLALADLALHQLPREHLTGYDTRIASVSPEAVAAARAVFPKDRDYAMVVIGDATTIADAIGRYGSVTHMRMTDPGFSPASP